MMRCQHSFSLVLTLSMLFSFALNSASDTGQEGLANQVYPEFAWKVQQISAPSDFNQSIRSVSTGGRREAGWLSSFSASISLADLDGDGLDNDVCLVDPRTDLISIRSVSAIDEAERYEPIHINPSTRSYYLGFISPFGCLPHDVNEDGAMDLLIYFAGRPPMVFFQTGPLEFQAADLLSDFGDKWMGWVSSSAVFADLNGDGMDDLILGGYCKDLMELFDWRASEFLPLPDPNGMGLNGGVNRLLMKEKDPNHEFGFRFVRNETYESDVRFQGWTTAVSSADLNGDGLPEIFFSNIYGRDYLWINQSSNKQLKLEPIELPVKPNAGLHRANSALIDDFDLDGDLELIIANEGVYSWDNNEIVVDSIPLNMAQSSQIQVDQGGWGWDIKCGDLNGDGYPEYLEAGGLHAEWAARLKGIRRLLEPSPNYLNAQTAKELIYPPDFNLVLPRNSFITRLDGGRYENLHSQNPLRSIDNLRAIALGDIDGDGDLDLASASQWMDAFILINETPQRGAYLSLKLLRNSALSKGEIRQSSGYKQASRGIVATGAQVLIEDFKSRRQLKEVMIGNGHGGHSSNNLFFGLGESPGPGKKIPVTIRWRDLSGSLQRERLKLSAGSHVIELGV